LKEASIEEMIGPLLIQRGMKLAFAESCTGGLIGHRVTNVAGSSEYYLGSVTAYAYEAKERFLGVKHETLLAHGAVSRETVIEMALGVRQALAADFPLDKTIGISVSGIAGPGGGMPGKPVGMVWMAISTPDGDHAFRRQFSGDRLQVKEQTAQTALQLLMDYLNGSLPEDND